MGERLILMAIPVFVVSMVIELYLTNGRGRKTYERRDTTASLLMGIGMLITAAPLQLVYLGLLTWLYEHRLWNIEMNVWGYLALLFCEDFCYYWEHRMNHTVRLFWAGHVNHHSSQSYHLATALRQSWTQTYMTFFWWLPLALIGFPPEWIVLQQAISLVYQFFIHTEVVHKLGPLEWIMNTPSHHRVHHAVNARYLDRNHAGIFIIWDRLFGTFQEELEWDPPVYGITKNLTSHNLFHVSFHEWPAIWRDLMRAPGLLNKLKYVFAPPGFSHDGSTMTSDQIRAAQLVSAAPAQ